MVATYCHVEDHILYVEVGKLDYRMFEFSCEKGDHNMKLPKDIIDRSLEWGQTIEGDTPYVFLIVSTA